MSRSEVRLSGLSNYLNAPPTGRARAAQNAKGGDYQFYKDYYARLREAVRRDRSTSRDGEALIDAAFNAPAKKRARYNELVSRWSGVCARWDSHTPAARPPRTVLSIGGLDVAITANLAEESASGEMEVVLVRFAEESLSSTVVDATLRLIQRAYPGTTAVFVDLARGKVTTSAGRRLHQYDSWLESEAAGLAHLLQMAA